MSVAELPAPPRPSLSQEPPLNPTLYFLALVALFVGTTQFAVVGLNGSVVQLSMAASAAVGGLVVAQGAVGSIGWVGAAGALLAAGLTVVSFELARRPAPAAAA